MQINPFLLGFLHEVAKIALQKFENCREIIRPHSFEKEFSVELGLNKEWFNQKGDRSVDLMKQNAQVNN